MNGSESWTTKTKYARRRVKAAETIYVRKTAVHTWPDYKTNTDFAKELNVTPVLTKHSTIKAIEFSK
jgi:hypothetical protein